MSCSLLLVALSVLILAQVASHQCYGIKGSAAISDELIRRQHLLKASSHPAFVAENSGKRTEMLGTSARRLQPGRKENDKIDRLPGQPDGVLGFNQYSGYVSVESKTGKTFFYYFVESSNSMNNASSSNKPLVLWFSAGICSPFGVGALNEIGPFRVNEDQKTLHLNPHAWNREANILFVEYAVGLGFSYSNSSSDYTQNGDTMATQDTYSFFISWLKRFPEYKQSDVFLGGDGDSATMVVELGRLILRNAYRNKINLKGIAVGNAFIDRALYNRGAIEFSWSHALIPDELYLALKSNLCDITGGKALSKKCREYVRKLYNLTSDINRDDIYSPSCNYPNPGVHEYEGPCSTAYVSDYIDNPTVQIALHAINVADHAPYPWKVCNSNISWTDFPDTVLPIITQLMEAGIPVWIYRWADIYAVGYKNLVFATVRGAGRYLPASQPARAFQLFSSFLNGNLPPASG